MWTELGTEEEYMDYLKNSKMTFSKNVAAFIRSQIGIDRRVALEKLAQFFSDNNFTSLQEEYLETIITYVSDLAILARKHWSMNLLLMNLSGLMCSEQILSRSGIMSSNFITRLL